MLRGIDTALFSPAHRYRSDDAFVIGYPGRLSPEKNVRVPVDVQRGLANLGMEAFVFPSETDTFGNVILEAMASGVPPIVATGGGPKYLAQSGVNGLRDANPGEFAAAILKLQQDSIWSAYLAANARRLRPFRGAQYSRAVYWVV